MQTRITTLFGIEHPIVLSGMSWVSTPELVAAVSNAGGLGLLATGTLSPEETRKAIRRIRELTDKPFGANTTLYFPAAEQNARVLIEEKVPVLNWSLGKGDWICQAVHAYGGKTVATVTTIKHAKAAERDGADALIVTGHEAGGHGGNVTSLVLVPAVADAVKLPIIAAGGFADHRGLMAALALGAEGISMGTRFMNTVESPVHEDQKKASNAVEVFDTVYTNKVDGLSGRFMKAPGTLRLVRRPLNPIGALIKSKAIADAIGLPWAKVALGIVLSGPEKSLQMARMAYGFDAFHRAIFDGDNERGALPLGQVAGLMSDTPTVKEVILRVVNG